MAESPAPVLLAPKGNRSPVKARAGDPLNLMRVMPPKEASHAISPRMRFMISEMPTDFADYRRFVFLDPCKSGIKGRNGCEATAGLSICG